MYTYFKIEKQTNLKKKKNLNFFLSILKKKSTLQWNYLGNRNIQNYGILTERKILTEKIFLDPTGFSYSLFSSKNINVTNLQWLGGYFLSVSWGRWIHLYSLEQVPQQMVLNQYFSGLDSPQTFLEVISFIMVKLEMAKKSILNVKCFCHFSLNFLFIFFLLSLELKLSSKCHQRTIFFIQNKN